MGRTMRPFIQSFVFLSSIICYAAETERRVRFFFGYGKCEFVSTTVVIIRKRQYKECEFWARESVNLLPI